MWNTYKVCHTLLCDWNPEIAVKTRDYLINVYLFNDEAKRKVGQEWGHHVASWDKETIGNHLIFNHILFCCPINSVFLFSGFWGNRYENQIALAFRPRGKKDNKIGFSQNNYPIGIWNLFFGIFPQYFSQINHIFRIISKPCVSLPLQGYELVARFQVFFQFQ